MNRKSIPKFVLLLSLLFLIWGCRATDETIASEKPKFFKVFGEKDNPSLNYSKGFKKLFESYDSIQIDKKTDFKPLTQTFVNKISSTQKNNNSQKEYIDFRFHSQTLKFEDDEVWVYFPIIQDNAVKQIAVAVLSENRTKVNLKLLNTNSQYYKQVYNLFAEAYTKVQNKQVSNNFTAKYAVTCEVGCTNIEEVVITVYEPKSKSETLLAFNWSLWENDGGGGSCGDFNNCFGSGGGFIGSGDGGYAGDGSNTTDPCAKAKELAQKMQEILNNTDVKSAIAQIKALMDQQKLNGQLKENAFAIGVDDSGKYHVSPISTSGIDNNKVGYNHFPTDSGIKQIGVYHNHSNDNSNSPGDFYELISSNLTYPNYFTNFVQNDIGEVFALNIYDRQKAMMFLQNYPKDSNSDGPGFKGELLADYYRFKSTADWTVNGNTNASQVALVAFLEYYDTGVSLSKQNTIDSNFKTFRSSSFNQTVYGGEQQTTYTTTDCN